MNLEEFTIPKRRIFETAVELFSLRSFETVSLEDIAHALDRKKPSIYNHFSSKQEILDTMYLFFEEHVFDERKTLEELKPLFETGTVLDMIIAVCFQFKREYKDFMSMCLTVIHQRKYCDERARHIVRELIMDEGIRYVEEAFAYAITIGRLAPFNTRWLALVINDTRNGEYLRSLMEPSYDRLAYISSEELLVYQHAAALVTDLQPPYEPRLDTAESSVL